MGRQRLVFAGVTAALMAFGTIAPAFAAGHTFRGHGFVTTQGAQSNKAAGHGAASATGRGVFVVKDSSGDTQSAGSGTGAKFHRGQYTVYCGTGSASATSSDGQVFAMGSGTMSAEGSGSDTVNGSYTATTQNGRSSSQLSVSHQRAMSAARAAQRFHRAHPATNRCA